MSHTLWTIQDIRVVHHLNYHKRYQASWGKVESESLSYPKYKWSWKEAYRWMAQQMAQRGVLIPRNRPPIWASDWPKPLIPTLEEFRYWECRIQMEVPEDLCVYSDIDLWSNYVLNHWEIGPDGIPVPNPPDKSIADIRKSWEVIFDRELQPAGEQDWQICLPYIEKDWILDIEICRAPKEEDEEWD